MHVYCEECDYDSGDWGDNEFLARQVNEDGGMMLMKFDEYGKPVGWELICPNGHVGESLHLD